MIERFNAEIEKIKARHLHRTRLFPLEDGLNFTSNDYLNLSEDHSIKQAFQQGFRDYPIGSSGSMVVSGYHPVHQQLEHAFIKALEVEDALLFSSGYSANIAITQLLAHYNVQVLIDKEVHSSIYDGLSLNKLPYKRYSHKNLRKLADYAKKSVTDTALITDSVFSMTGNQVDLKHLVQTTSSYGIGCIIDEAHAFGVKGLRGMGAIEEAGLTMQDIPLRIIPFGKALACQGAIVAGQRDWIDALLQQARSFIYSTAMSPAMAFGLIHSLETVVKAQAKRNHLQQLIEYFNQKITQDIHQWNPSANAIQLLILKEAQKALAYSELLRKKGIFLVAIRPPSVTKKNTGLRIILNAGHSFRDIEYLFSQLRDCYDRLY